jgi:hypothetical protein
MSPSLDFDLVKAHRYFAAECFNRTWDFIDKPSRSAEEGQTMLLMSMASLWHWTQRPDVTPTNLSMGYWQVSRVHALLGQAENARQFGQMCLRESQREGVLPFYLGMAYESLARAEAVGGNRAEASSYIALARRAGEKITDVEEKKILDSDLATIEAI